MLLPRCTLTLPRTQQKRYRGFSEIIDPSSNWHCERSEKRRPKGVPWLIGASYRIWRLLAF